jgi:hypothetical protein
VVTVCNPPLTLEIAANFPHGLYLFISYDSHNKRRLFPWRAQPAGHCNRDAVLMSRSSEMRRREVW